MRYEDIFDSEGVPCGESERAILLVDDRMRFLDANQAALRILGYSLDELLTRAVSDIIPDSRRGEALELWNSFTASGELIGDFLVLTKSGQRIAVHYHAVAEVAPGVHLSELTLPAGGSPSPSLAGASRAAP